MRMVHIDLSQGTPEKNQEALNRLSSLAHTMLEVMEVCKEDGHTKVPLEVIQHIMWSIMSKQDPEFEKELKLVTKAGLEKDYSKFQHVNGKENLPDNVVRLKGNGVVH